eukprot:TRINITY_DN371_c0_g1_i1.p1 TRINITY_DN371_c0_g1~~TRINITY_DN371_c0_g1_i1.p1  ORF type:complete len:1096 (+),score=258.44 TRINITY_DN371_c0_g1_i1:146-3289(+)
MQLIYEGEFVKAEEYLKCFLNTFTQQTGANKTQEDVPTWVLYSLRKHRFLEALIVVPRARPAARKTQVTEVKEEEPPAGAAFSQLCFTADSASTFYLTAVSVCKNPMPEAIVTSRMNAFRILLDELRPLPVPDAALVELSNLLWVDDFRKITTQLSDFACTPEFRRKFFQRILFAERLTQLLADQKKTELPALSSRRLKSLALQGAKYNQYLAKCSGKPTGKLSLLHDTAEAAAMTSPLHSPVALKPQPQPPPPPQSPTAFAAAAPASDPPRDPGRHPPPPPPLPPNFKRSAQTVEAHQPPLKVQRTSTPPPQSKPSSSPPRTKSPPPPPPRTKSPPPPPPPRTKSPPQTSPQPQQQSRPQLQASAASPFAVSSQRRITPGIAVSNACFHPKHDTVVFLGSSKGDVVVYDLQRLTETHKVFDVKRRAVTQLRCSPLGTMLGVCFASGMCELRPVVDKLVCTLESPVYCEPLPTNPDVRDIYFEEDAQNLLVFLMCANGACFQYRVDRVEATGAFHGVHKDMVHYPLPPGSVPPELECVAYHTLGSAPKSYLMTWRLLRGRTQLSTCSVRPPVEVREPLDFAAGITEGEESHSVIFCGDALIICGTRTLLRVRDLREQRAIFRRFAGFTGGYRTVPAALQSRYLIVGDHSKLVIWDTQQDTSGEFQPVATLPLQTSTTSFSSSQPAPRVTLAACSALGQRLILVLESGAFLLAELYCDGKQLQEVPCTVQELPSGRKVTVANSPLAKMAFARDGTLYALTKSGDFVGFGWAKKDACARRLSVVPAVQQPASLALATSDDAAIECVNEHVTVRLLPALSELPAPVIDPPPEANVKAVCFIHRDSPGTVVAFSSKDEVRVHGPGANDVTRFRPNPGNPVTALASVAFRQSHLLICGFSTGSVQCLLWKDGAYAALKDMSSLSASKIIGLRVHSDGEKLLVVQVNLITVKSITDAQFHIYSQLDYSVVDAIFSGDFRAVVVLTQSKLQTLSYQQGHFITLHCTSLAEVDPWPAISLAHNAHHHNSADRLQHAVVGFEDGAVCAVNVYKDAH